MGARKTETEIDREASQYSLRQASLDFFGRGVAVGSRLFLFSDLSHRDGVAPFWPGSYTPEHLGSVDKDLQTKENESFLLQANKGPVDT